MTEWYILFPQVQLKTCNRRRRKLKNDHTVTIPYTGYTIEIYEFIEQNYNRPMCRSNLLVSKVYHLFKIFSNIGPNSTYSGDKVMQALN
jgi:hypothetical protein